MTASEASLVIGAGGLLGRAVSARLRSLGQRVVETMREPADGILRLDLEAMAVPWLPPAGVTTVYFCAAVTSQTACRTSFERAYAVNVTGTVRLIRRLVDAGIFVVFPSTNLVFDGSQPRALPDAPRCPRTAYGRMKAEAETSLLALGAGVGIVRLSKVVHGHLPVFAEWRASLAGGVDVHPFHDLVFSPLPLRDAVSVLVAVGRSRAPGVTQASAQDDVSYAHACRLLASRLRIPDSCVKSISWQASDQRFEHVPRHTTLDASRARELCGFTPPPAREALEAVFAAPGPLGPPS